MLVFCCPFNKSVSLNGGSWEDVHWSTPSSAALKSCVLCLVAQWCPTLCDPHGLQPSRLLCPWGFSRQEYWSELPCPPPRDLPTPGMEPTSLASPALQVGSFTTSAIWEVPATEYARPSTNPGIEPRSPTLWGGGEWREWEAGGWILYHLSHQ